jgi:hypothetical protein
MFAALSGLDWRGQDFYTYLAVAGAVVIALAVGLYAVPGGKLKVPGILVAIVGGIGLGVAAGVILMGTMGYDMKTMEGDPGSRPDVVPGQPSGVMANMGRGMPGGGMPGGGMPGRGGRGGGPNYKGQLANLIGKLDVLTDKPLTIRLSDEQRTKVKELLKGLDGDELSDEEAQKKSEELHELLKDQKDTLEAAGYRWPGEGGGRGGGRGGRGGRGGPGGPSNPFKTDDNAKHLKSLEDRLDKKA